MPVITSLTRPPWSAQSHAGTTPQSLDAAPRCCVPEMLSALILFHLSSSTALALRLTKLVADLPVPELKVTRWDCRSLLPFDHLPDTD